jgi:two-component system cell cycle sensor histidine kinase/response regulator CckA
MGQTILVLEDNLITLGVVEAILRQAGHEVLKATNEAAALGHVKKYAGRIELLIADATMAGRMNGRMVRSLQESRPEMNVLFMSGYSKEDLVTQGFLDPDGVFLPKPFTVKFLRNMVDSLLERPCPTIPISAGPKLVRSPRV